MDKPVYTLYGSYASYASAKPRSYLRKKGIPFVERLPATPRFREYVRKTSDNHRIPQIESPDGLVIQDSIAIFDKLEQHYPDPPAYPPGVRQKLATRLLEFLIDATLSRTAWHYRWNYKAENYDFVGREFGRSFSPYGSNEELAHFGDTIAERMQSFRSTFGDTPEIRPVWDQLYLDVLAILDEQFRQYPYLFGGLPSIADHIMMGPMFGHLGRDPVPANIMKLKAPRVYRWIEHMNTPEIVSPEHHGCAEAYLADDEIPEQTLAFLRFCIEHSSSLVINSVQTFNKWAAGQSEKVSGDLLSDKPGDHEPKIGEYTTTLCGVPMKCSVWVNEVWVIQRVLEWFAGLPVAEQDICRSFMADCGGAELLDLKIERRLTRVGTYMAFE